MNNNTGTPIIASYILKIKEEFRRKDLEYHLPIYEIIFLDKKLKINSKVIEINVYENQTIAMLVNLNQFESYYEKNKQIHSIPIDKHEMYKKLDILDKAQLFFDIDYTNLDLEKFTIEELENMYKKDIHNILRKNIKK